jgi:hypothetical protein
MARNDADGGAISDERNGASFADILQATPDEIQAWLDYRLENAPPDVQAAIAAVDYVEPGSIRDPDCTFYIAIGDYTGDRDTIEIAFQAKPGAEAAFLLALKLL